MHQLTNSQAIYEPNYRRQYQLSYGLEMAVHRGLEPLPIVRQTIIADPYNNAPKWPPHKDSNLDRRFIYRSATY